MLDALITLTRQNGEIVLSTTSTMMMYKLYPISISA